MYKYLSSDIRSEDWLMIFWPSDEYKLIKLSTENKLDQIYAEAEKYRSVLEQA